MLFTTRAAASYLDHAFAHDDVLLFGRESSGAGAHVHAAADARLLIPMRQGCARSTSPSPRAMAIGEALRQLDAFPQEVLSRR